ncbi:MAG: nitroreductase family protein [Lentisphaeria bacterium]|nr:nitroreductase family protein [Lentisphaeria bacterium]
MTRFTVDAARCTQCDLCVRDCPVRIIERPPGGFPRIIAEEEGDCMACQHCLAICPEGAISIFGRRPENSLSLDPAHLPRVEALERLVRGRRSVRHYRDENVDPELLARLLSVLANAPTGVNRQELTFRVIDDREVMQRFRVKAMGELAAEVAAGRIPEQFSMVNRLVAAYVDEGRDLVFRGAPHVLVVTAPPDAPCGREDIALALAYFELLAQSAGLGTVWCGLMSLVLSARPQLKADLGIPGDHLHYQMLFGVPAIRYARTVQRDDGAEIRRVLL